MDLIITLNESALEEDIKEYINDSSIIRNETTNATNFDSFYFYEVSNLESPNPYKNAILIFLLTLLRYLFNLRMKVLVISFVVFTEMIIE